MKPTLFDEVRSLSKLEEIISFFGNLDKIKAVVEELKIERAAIKKQFDQLALGNRVKGLEEAAVAAEKSLKTAMESLNTNQQRAADLLQEAEAQALAIHVKTEESLKDLELRMQVFSDVKAETENTLATREKKVFEQAQALAEERKQVQATQATLDKEKARLAEARKKYAEISY